jgi:hypothetical protein
LRQVAAEPALEFGTLLRIARFDRGVPLFALL